MNRFFRALAVAALSAGCAAPPPPPPATDVSVTVTGAQDMNGGAPAQVKLYYLASAATFEVADFFGLFDAPEATLGTDLLAVETLQLVPGRTAIDTRRFDRPPAALGVVAAFREIDRGRFRAVRPIEPDTANDIAVTLTGSAVVIAR